MYFYNMKPKTFYNSLKIISIFCFVFIGHHFLIRPWMLDWGAPSEIQKLHLSGDNLSEGEVHTRSVLIHAAPEKIWPWIIQIGQERGGFYSYTWLENIFFADMHNVYEIKPELQLPRMVGDTVWMASKHRYKAKGHQIIAQIVPNNSIIMVSGEDYNRIKTGKKATGSWSFYLYPESPESTWLVARSCGADQSGGDRLLRYVFYEVPHFIMEQKMLRTIKKLSER
jgi:hypothetical protein